MLLLYIRCSGLYFCNIWSLLLFFHGCTDGISSSGGIQGDPFRDPPGLQRRRVPQVLGAGGGWGRCCCWFASTDTFQERILVQDAQLST